MSPIHMMCRDLIKSQFTQYCNFHNGFIQQYAFECILLLMDIINKGPIPCSVNP